MKNWIFSLIIFKVIIDTAFSQGLRNNSSEGKNTIGDNNQIFSSTSIQKVVDFPIQPDDIGINEIILDKNLIDQYEINNDKQVKSYTVDAQVNCDNLSIFDVLSFYPSVLSIAKKNIGILQWDYDNNFQDCLNGNGCCIEFTSTLTLERMTVWGSGQGIETNIYDPSHGPGYPEYIQARNYAWFLVNEDVPVGTYFGTISIAYTVKNATTTDCIGWSCNEVVKSGTDEWYFELDVYDPTAISLVSFTAVYINNSVILKWNTESELGIAGFNIYRCQIEEGKYEKINQTLIPSQGTAVTGATYTYIDISSGDQIYYYKLEEISHNGSGYFHGPISVIIVTSIENDLSFLRNNLLQNYPNPFNSVTTIIYKLQSIVYTDVRVEIYDINGRKIRTLVGGEAVGGKYSVEWDGRDDKGFNVTSGVYFYQIKNGDLKISRKLILIR